MNDCEKLFAYLLAEMKGCSLPVALHEPWEKISVEEAFKKYCSVTPEEALQQDSFDILLVEKIEPYLGRKRPAFLYDYPLELASLARPKPGRPSLAERFELYVTGIELANGFSELTDPVLQRSRFEEECRKMDTNLENRKKIPELFLEALESLDKAAGIAMGLDRLFMLFLEENKLDSVVTFAPGELDK